MRAAPGPLDFNIPPNQEYTSSGTCTATAKQNVFAIFPHMHQFGSHFKSSDTWKTHFSGKEILIDMLTRVWTKKRPPDPEGRRDFYKAIAQAQRDYQTVPKEILDLRVALRSRLGL